MRDRIVQQAIEKVVRREARRMMREDPYDFDFDPMKSPPTRIIVKVKDKGREREA